MSTILEALRELEGHPAAPPPPPEQPPWRDGSRRTAVVIAVIAAATLVCGAVALVLALRSGMPVQTASAPAQPAAAPRTPPRMSPHIQQHATSTGERPIARIVAGPSKTAPDPVPRADTIARATAPPPAAVPVAEPPARPAPPPEPAVTRIIGAPPVQPRRETAALPRPAGAPHVRVTALSYADRAGERAVRLAVDEGIPVTLREGEAADGIEVQLILPDRVYVRYGANVFAVDARN